LVIIKELDENQALFLYMFQITTTDLIILFFCGVITGTGGAGIS